MSKPTANEAIDLRIKLVMADAYLSSLMKGASGALKGILDPDRLRRELDAVRAALRTMEQPK
jgi:hypothetical protein